MKTHISAFIIVIASLPAFLISSGTKMGERLIFPNPAEKICFVMATGKKGGLLVGKKLHADGKRLSQKFLYLG